MTIFKWNIPSYRHGQNTIMNPLFASGLQLFLLLFLLVFLPQNLRAEEPKRVLFISSYHPAFPTFSQQVDGIKSVLEKKSILLDIEFMDSKRFPEQTNFDNFHQSLATKLSSIKPYDAIISADDNALLFAIKHQKKLFHNIPIVFMGVNNVNKALEQNSNPFITGVVEAVSMKETLALMTGLQPRTKRIVAIVDGTPSGQGDLETFYRHKKGLAPVELAEISLVNLSFEEFSAQLRTLSENDAVLLLSAYRDKNGETLTFHKSLKLIKENLAKPLYHLWHHGIGEGVLGGKVICHTRQGEAAAGMVGRILGGTPVKDIPVLVESPNSYVFDYNELKRFGFHVSDLPEGSTILHQPFSYYQHHQELISTVVLSLMILVLFILGMGTNIYRRKQTENALRESREMLHLVLDNIPQFVFWKDRNSVYQGCNQNFAIVAGVDKPENIIGKTDYDFAWKKEEADFFLECDRRVMGTGTPELHIIEKQLQATGKQALLDTNKIPLRDARGHIVGILGTYEDITERKKAEGALLASREQYQSLVETIDDWVWEVDKNGVYTYASPRVKDLLGYEPEELIGKTFADLMPEPESEKALAFFRYVLKQGKPFGSFENSNYHKDGHLVVLETSGVPFFDQENNLLGYRGVDRDITARKQSEEALQEREATLNSILAAAPIGIGLTQDRIVQWASESLLKMVGYSDEELIGKSARIFYENDKEFERVGRVEYGAMEKEGMGKIETRWKRKDGKVIDILLSSAYLDLSNPSSGTTFTAMDITDRKRAEAIIKGRLDSLIQPVGETIGLSLEHLFDLDEIQKIQDTFAKATGVASIITDTEGRPITRPSNFCRLCKDIIRNTEKGLTNCMHSDSLLGRVNPDGPTIQPCLSGGLWDGGASITVGDRHIANWLVGQVRNKQQDEKTMLAYARSIGADEQEFQTALAEVNVMSTEQFEQICNALFVMAKQLSTLAYKNVQQARAIHEKDVAENALRESEVRYRTIIDSSPFFVFLIRDGKFVYANPFGLEWFGFSKPSEIHGITLEKNIDPAQIPAIRQCLKKTLEGQANRPMVVNMIRRDGEIRHCETVSVPIRLEEGHATLVMGQDITERKHLEEEKNRALADAKEQREKIEAILNSLAEGLIFTDIKNRIVMISPSTEEMLEQKLKHVFLQPAETVIDEISFIDQLDAILTGRKEQASVDLELFSKKDGEERTIQAKSSLVGQKEGEKAGVITSLRDISRERKLDRMKSEFIATAAHELRTPLTAVKGFSELLISKKNFSPEDQKEYLSIIHEKSNLLTDIVNGLLNISRVESGRVIHLEKQKCDIGSLVQRCTHQYKKEFPGHRFEVIIPDEPVQLLVDESKIGQTMENLLSNAVKFSAAGSLVKVTCKNFGQEIQIAVSDDGVGMTSSQLEKVFDKFYKVDTSDTAVGGLGLGMSIVKAIIETHDGRIWVESEPDKGTTVIFTLPLASPEDQGNEK